MKTTNTTDQYQNNPFLIAIDGVKLLFNKAQNTAIFLAVLSLVAAYVGTMPEDSVSEPEKSYGNVNIDLANDWPVLAIIAIAVLLFMIGLILLTTYVQAIADYTSSQLAKGKSADLSEASSQAGKKFLGYLWVQIIVGVKIILWSLLLIIPGIYKANRYSLAGVAYFSEPDMKGDKALQRSQQLTDGAWLTTFAGMSFFNIVTFGVLSLLLTTGSKITLYRQLSALVGKPKPAASPLSWLIFIVPALAVSILVFLGVVLYMVGIG